LEIIGKDNVKKSHYSVKKRKKELERKQKQEHKRQRKLNKNVEELGNLSESPQGEDNEFSSMGK